MSSGLALRYRAVVAAALVPLALATACSKRSTGIAADEATTTASRSAPARVASASAPSATPSEAPRAPSDPSAPFFSAHIGEKYEHYTNARYCFEVDGPAEVRSLGESFNGDGTTWRTGDETEEVVAFGGHAMKELHSDIDTTWAGAIAEDPSGGSKVTYKVREKDFFVVSGTSDGGKRIFYSRYMYRAGEFAAFTVQYPATEREVVGRLVERMTKTFKFTKCSY
jgi:hypothetical protein